MPATHAAERAAADVRLTPRSGYLALATASMQRSVAYRNTTIMNLVSNLVWMVVLFHVWQSVYKSSPSALHGYDWELMRTYLLVAFATNALLSLAVESEMFFSIGSGRVAVELMRPLDYMSARLAEALGAAAFEGAIAGAMAFSLGALVFGATPPASGLAALLFLPSVLLGFLVKFLLSFLIALLCFRTLNTKGLVWARAAVTDVLSGALVPLAFLPDWLHALAASAPFQAIIHTPVSVYLGRLEGDALWHALGAQLLWVAALWLLARVLWRPAVRVVTVQGG